jgi:hypothetical protein
MMRLKRNTWINVFIFLVATVGGSVVGGEFVLLTFPASPLPTLHAMTTEATGAGTTSADRQSLRVR